MPSTIPYDPSLVLGNIVTQPKLDIVTAIAAAQAPADAAEDTLNSLISLKRSIDMTVQELIEMNIDATSLIQESQDTGKQITAAATRLVARMTHNITSGFLSSDPQVTNNPNAQPPGGGGPKPK